MLYDVPGARSAPFDFDKFTGNLGEEGGSPPCAIEPSCDTSKSPICKYGISAGDNTIDMCEPPKPNCPMSRKWVPERNIDSGRWTLVDDKKDVEEDNVLIVKTKSKNYYLMYFIVLVIIAYLMRKRI